MPKRFKKYDSLNSKANIYEMERFIKKYPINDFEGYFFFTKKEKSYTLELKWKEFITETKFDFIIYKNKVHEIHPSSWPIGSYFEVYPDKKPTYINIDNPHTRMNIAIYKIENNELILDHIVIKGLIYRTGWRSIFDRNNKKINKFFNYNNKVKINTFTGKMMVFNGEPTNANEYGTLTTIPIFEKYIILDIVDGNIIEEKEISCLTYLESLIQESTERYYAYKFYSTLIKKWHEKKNDMNSCVYISKEEEDMNNKPVLESAYINSSIEIFNLAYKENVPDILEIVIVKEGKNYQVEENKEFKCNWNYENCFADFVSITFENENNANFWCGRDMGFLKGYGFECSFVKENGKWIEQNELRRNWMS